jgi:hypothetical protein
LRTRPLFFFLIGTLLAWGALRLGRPYLYAGDGLAARYYRNPERVGVPAFEGPDGVPSRSRLAQRRSDALPESFSVVWDGYLSVSEPGLYHFETTSDDGSWCYVDGRLIVDNGGAHGPATQSGAIHLVRGPHQVRLEYVQLGGTYELQWAWRLEGGPRRPIPLWALSTRPVTRQRASLVRALDAISAALAFACAIASAWTAIFRAVPAAVRGLPVVLGTVMTHYQSPAAFAVSVAACVALLLLPRGPWGLLDTLMGTARQLGAATSVSLTHFSTFRANLDTPHAGEARAIPARVLTMVELLDRYGPDRYALSPAVSENNWVHQQMVATAWPRRLERDAPERFILSTEPIPVSCHLVESEGEVTLVRCP